MNVTDRAMGRPSLALGDVQIRRFIRLLLEGARAVRAEPPAGTNERRLCRALYLHMQRIKRHRSPSLNLRIERESTVEDDDLDADEAPEGRLDFKIIFPRQLRDEQQYLGVEAKLLRQRDGELARRYVRNGLARFRDGLYGPETPHGMMLGIVRQGDVGPITAMIGRCVVAEWGEVVDMGPALPFEGALAVHRHDLERMAERPAMDVFHVFVDLGGDPA